MIKSLFELKAAATAVGLSLLFAAFGALAADPPWRVARLGYMSGAVSIAPAGDDSWIEAGINRPLTTGDRVWLEPGARAELQLGGAMVRLAAGTAVALLDLDDNVTQLQLSEGSLNLRVRRIERGQVFEIDTPNLAFTINEPGVYRIDVDPADDATTVTVRSGRGEVVAGNEAYTIDAGQPYRFTGDGLREYGAVASRGLDEFDRWSNARDRAEDNSVSARYVSRDVVGYQDLDAHGSWRVDVNFGPVWTPSRVPAGWSPYSTGRWAWVDPWGWTWVDDAPWGFAVSHYGRWTQSAGGWGWVPGPVASRAYYAPALVVFIGGDNFQITLSSGAVSGVGWFPLAPREIYRPSYPVSRSYYESLNRSNTVVNTTIINNTYNNTTINVGSFANHRVPGAVIAVPRTTFVQSQPVARVAVRPVRDDAARQPLAFAPAVAPIESSVRGGATRRDQPPVRVFDKPVVVRKAPPAAPPSLAQQLPKLAAQPGKPLDESDRKQIAPAAGAVRAPTVRVATPPRETPRAVPALPAEKSAVEPTPRAGRGVTQPPATAPERRDTLPSRPPPDATPPQPVPRAMPDTRESKPTAPERAQPPGRKDAERVSPPALKDTDKTQPPAMKEAERVPPPASKDADKVQPPARREVERTSPPAPRDADNVQPPARREVERASPPAPKDADRMQPPARKEAENVRRPAPQDTDKASPPVKKEAPQPAAKKEQAQAPAPAASKPAARTPAPKDERVQASRPATGRPDVQKKNDKDEDPADAKKPRDRKGD